MIGTRVPIGFVNSEPVYSIFGSRQGYNTEGDILVNQTADGVDLNTVWAEQRAAMALYNEQKNAVMRLLCYPTTRAVELVAQSVRGAKFGRPPSSVFRRRCGRRPSISELRWISATTTWPCGTPGGLSEFRISRASSSSGATRKGVRGVTER